MIKKVVISAAGQEQVRKVIFVPNKLINIVV